MNKFQTLIVSVVLFAAVFIAVFVDEEDWKPLFGGGKSLSEGGKSLFGEWESSSGGEGGETRTSCSACIFPSQKEIHSKFPGKIGDYSRGYIEDLQVCDKSSDTLIAAVRTVYPGPGDFPEEIAYLLYGVYATEEVCKKYYNDERKEKEEYEIEIGGVRGLYMTESYLSGSRLQIRFVWLEGNIMKGAGIDTPKPAGKSEDDFEKENKEKLRLFVEAFKGV